MRFTARTHRAGAWSVVTLTGELDLASAPTARCELSRAEHETALVLVDLRAVSFMDSTGLHMVLDASRRLADRHGRLVLVDGPRPVHRLLELTGAIERLEVVRDPLQVLMRDPAAGSPGVPSPA